MERYASLMRTALGHLDEATAGAAQIQRQIGSLNQKESLLAILDALDYVEVALSNLSYTELRQAAALLDQQQKRAESYRQRAGIQTPFVQ